MAYFCAAQWPGFAPPLTAGALIPYVNRAPYAASKRALLALMVTLAWEVGREGIRVNAILPGLTRGERQENVLRKYASLASISEQEALDHYLKRQATGKIVEPDEVASMVMFLASHEARSVTGQFIGVDGGFF